MSRSVLCLSLLAVVARASAAPSGAWPVVTYAQSYSAHAVDHSVAQSVVPAVAATPILRTAPLAEPLVASSPYIAAPGPVVARQLPYAAAAPLVASPYAAAAPLVASPYAGVAPIVSSPYAAAPLASPYIAF